MRDIGLYPRRKPYEKKPKKWNYYGVKIIKQIIIEGESIPDLIDRNFVKSTDQMFEESVILIHA